jgi:uracil-DNA glycosylase
VSSIVTTEVQVEELPLLSVTVMVTVHPSSILRLPDEGKRKFEYDTFVADLTAARQWLSRSSTC